MKQDENFEKESVMESETDPNPEIDALTDEASEILAEDGACVQAETPTEAEELSITDAEPTVPDTGEPAPLSDELSAEAAADAASVTAAAAGTATATAASVATAAATGGILIKTGYLIAAIVGVVVLTTTSLLVGMSINKGDDSKIPGVDPDAKYYDDIGADIAKPEKDQMSIPGFESIGIPAGKKNVQIVLLNPEGNPCYFTYTLVLTETGEELYRSGLVPPGMAVVDIELSRPLEAGDYELQIIVETVSLDDRIPMNGANLKTVLNVR